MLKSVRLQNFRCFRDVRVVLGRRNVLVGPNMSGKSNFLELFRFLKRVASPMAGASGLASAFVGGFEAYTWWGGDSRLIAIALEGDGPDPADRLTAWRYELSIVGDERGDIRVQEEQLVLTREGRDYSLIRRQDGMREAVNCDGRQVLTGVDPTRSILEFEIPAWEGGFLRDWILKCCFYRLDPRAMRKVNFPAAPRFLSETGDNLAAWLMLLQTRYSDMFQRVERVCRDVLPDFFKLFSWPTEQGTVMFGSEEKYLRRAVSMWDMSDGELVFVALLSLIFSPPALGAPLYFVEEPENHLHPRLIEILVELLGQVHDELGPSRSAQVVASTHSPFLVDNVSLDELIVFERQEGATVVTYPRDKGHLRKLLERRELGLGDLVYSGALSGV
jgi:predicted ATPase